MQQLLYGPGGTSPRLWGDSLSRNTAGQFKRYIPTPVGRLTPEQVCPCYRPVHPHACGEIDARTGVPVLPTGTSPRLWGDFSCQNAPHVPPRYIPTPVGRFNIRNVNKVIIAVHPHACGEIYRRTKTEVASTGTSPRLWGDFCGFGCGHVRFRYIPTPVGRFDAAIDASYSTAVHPHACGEITNIYPKKNSCTTISCIFRNLKIRSTHTISSYLVSSSQSSAMRNSPDS